MTAYRAGQRVRIEWDGEAHVIEGPVELMNGHPFVRAPLGLDKFWLDRAPVTITVLSEPRPDEPTGLGAVVEAEFCSPHFATEKRERWVRRPGSQIQSWASESGDSAAMWQHLAFPVVLSEGWTP